VNLLVPICLSATHVAYGSMRMEPAYMSLGQVAATAAGMAIDAAVSVQEVPYARLRERLLEDRVTVEWKS
jgi:Cu/Ag efflux pump CusA